MVVLIRVSFPHTFFYETGYLFIKQYLQKCVVQGMSKNVFYAPVKVNPVPPG